MAKRREPAGRVSYTWDGRDDASAIVSEGVYRPRVQLERNGRTIVLPNSIRVDTTAPTITLRSVFPRVFSPDGDRKRDRVTATYRIDERARPISSSTAASASEQASDGSKASSLWFGRVDGRVVRAGNL